jgi:hypothetical protein
MMNLNIPSLRRYGDLPVRRLGLFAAVVAAVVMSVVTVAVTTSGRDANGYGSRPVVVATDRHTATTTPTGAGPLVQAPAWQEGSWPGMGSNWFDSHKGQ